MRGPRITIVTPWRDHLELADDYFEAVLPELERGDVNVIVDNASSPALAFGAIRSETNLGFSAGCNLGLDAAETSAVLFLNNDVRLVRRGWLDEIRALLDDGVLVGPLRHDRHADVDGHKLPYIDGWCLAGMTRDLRDLGGFDETLAEPAYYSDNLLCLEARARGMALREVRPGLQHLENATAGPAATSQVRAATMANRVRYETRARELLVAA